MPLHIIALAAASETQYQVQCRFFLNVVVGQGAAIFQLLAGKDESLLVRWNSLLILDLGFHIIDGVASLHIQSDGLASQSLHEDLHSSSETQYQVQCRFFLNVVVGQGAAIFRLLAGKDESLLVRWNSLL